MERTQLVEVLVEFRRVEDADTVETDVHSESQVEALEDTTSSQPVSVLNSRPKK